MPNYVQLIMLLFPLLRYPIEYPSSLAFQLPVLVLLGLIPANDGQNYFKDGTKTELDYTKWRFWLNWKAQSEFENIEIKLFFSVYKFSFFLFF